MRCVCAFGQFCEVWRFLGGSLLLLKRWLQSEAFDPRKVDKGRAFNCQQCSQGQLTQHVCVQIKAPKVLVEFQAASIQFYHWRSHPGHLWPRPWASWRSGKIWGGELRQLPRKLDANRYWVHSIDNKKCRSPRHGWYMIMHTKMHFTRVYILCIFMYVHTLCIYLSIWSSVSDQFLDLSMSLNVYPLLIFFFIRILIYHLVVFYCLPFPSVHTLTRYSASGVKTNTKIFWYSILV